ncbi:MAG: formylglycine-generating enzyme family protein [Verrucomicrobiota bacterium]|nr:formylglycine-generating enzyme family protein [Verrucomicrobiota bacterium]
MTKKKKHSKLRYMIWVIEIIVVLALIEHVFIKKDLTLLKTNDKKEFDTSIFYNEQAIYHGEDIVTQFKGLEEVKHSYYAKTDRLAPGSPKAMEKQKEWVNEKKFPLEIKNSLGMIFRLIPPGTFLMGSPETEKGRGICETPHKVTIKNPFYITKHEVTIKEWKQLMKINKNSFKGINTPAEEMTWYDCQRFIKKLCKREGVPKGRYRLPTEEEWEYACRAGTSTAFYFGDSTIKAGDFMEYLDSESRRTSVVGQKIPNAWGLFNMHGNVWEWCLEIYTDYLSGLQVDGNKRCIRGGNWYSPLDECRSANRCRLTATSHGNLLGFRLIRSIVKEVPYEILEAQEKHSN